MKRMKPFFLVCFLGLGSLFSFHFAIASNSYILPEDTTIRLIQDDPIIAMLDSMLTRKYFEVARKSANKKIVSKYGFEPDSIPVYDKLVYKARMENLDTKSPLSLDYNDVVQGYINLYAFRKREQVNRMLGLAEYYFPLFEEKLDKYNMPLELKYLAIVESALNANAKSRVGATGLWQFMYGTGKMYNLKIDSYIDERNDPIKSTEAACQYMKFLYKMFGDWQLVLAAYNAGPGTVNKAIRRSGGKMNYWDLRPHLPAETRGYVPAFIAVNYIMNHPEEHNFYPLKPMYYKHEADTICIKGDVSFEQISAVLGVPVDHLQFLNPVYKKNFIPGAQENSKFTICLPSAMIAAFMNNDSLIYAYNRPAVTGAESFTVQENIEPVGKTHVVRSGEHLTSIAKKYRCTVHDLREWNKLKSNKLYKGQKLLVYTNTPPKPLEQSAQKAIEAETAKENSVKNPDSATSEPTGKKYVYYTVQPGDTLWHIANKYEGVSIEDIKRLNNIKNAKSIKAGTKIKVSVAG